MRFFYARCSTKMQNEARQLEYAKSLGFEDSQIFIDKASGKNMHRPALLDMLSRLREGDEVYVTELSRLGRNTRDLLNLMHRFELQGVEVKSKKENIDTSTPAGQLVFKIFASVAEFQRQIILENAAEGREAARRQGKPIGRPKSSQKALDYAMFLYTSYPTKSMKEICEEAGLSRSTVYREIQKRGVSRGHNAGTEDVVSSDPAPFSTHANTDTSSASI